jgi:hypothetical protein
LKLIPELKLSVGQAIAENRYPDDYLKIVEEVERGKNGLKGGLRVLGSRWTIWRNRISVR